jgi:hypothetical protein
MLNLVDLVNSQFSEGVISSLAQRFGMSTEQAQGAIQSLIPSLLGGLANNATNEEGAGKLSAALDKHDGSALNDVQGFVDNMDDDQIADGEKIVNHAMQGNQQDVQAHVAESYGLDVSQVSGLMSSIAPMIMNVLGQQKQAGGMDASGLMGLLGGNLGNIQSMIPAGIMDKLSGLFGGGGAGGGGMLGGLEGMIGNFFGKK